jgi:negative regulator of sigma E activity
MDCGTFLDGYSDLRDDLLPLPERVRFESHLRGCASCARYDRVVKGGVDVLLEAEELQVADDFMDRLQHRLYHVDDEMSAARRRRARPLGRNTAAAAAVAATVAGIALLPQLRTAPTVTMLPTVAASAPAPAAESRYLADGADGAGLAARLEEVGVQVFPLPYRQVVHRSASMVTLASYAAGE